MKKLFGIVMLLATAIFAVSCNDEKEENWSEVEQRSLDAWMAKYVPDAAKHSSGMYYQIITSAPASADIPYEGDWVRVNYEGKSLAGNIFVTRDSMTAVKEGTSTLYTHYVPKMVQLKSTNTALFPAMYNALKLMKLGEKIRIYTPSSQAFGSTGSGYSGGYQGQRSLSGNTPCVMDIELVEIFANPSLREDKLVQDYIKQQGFAVADSLKWGMYAKIMPNDPDADSVKIDSTLHIYYIGRFLDGFVFETNIDSLAVKYFNNSDTQTPLPYLPKENTSDGDAMTYVFYYAIPKMVYDSWCRVITVSKYAYGSTGSAGNTEIDPYTPLIFDFYIKSNKKTTD